MKKLLIIAGVTVVGAVVVRQALRNEALVAKATAVGDAVVTAVVGVVNTALTKYDEFVTNSQAGDTRDYAEEPKLDDDQYTGTVYTGGEAAGR